MTSLAATLYERVNPKRHVPSGTLAPWLVYKPESPSMESVVQSISLFQFSLTTTLSLARQRAGQWPRCPSHGRWVRVNATGQLSLPLTASIGPVWLLLAQVAQKF